MGPHQTDHHRIPDQELAGRHVLRRTPAEAFYVKIDESLNPPSEQALGRLNVEIGVRPTYPAEFIIVRIGIRRDGTEVATA